MSEDKFFLHYVSKSGYAYDKGINVYDNLNAAKCAFHSYMKMAYDNPLYPDMKLMLCMITDKNDNIILGYNESWNKGRVGDNFVHYIYYNGIDYTMGIDVYGDYGAACRDFHARMEKDMIFVAGKITNANGLEYKSETRIKDGYDN